MILFERADGERWYWSGGEVPLLAPGAQPWGSEHQMRRPRGVEYHLDMRPGTRRSRGATVEYDYGDSKEMLEFTPILDFQMKGLGYLNLEWGHGVWKGDEAIGSESWKLDALDPCPILEPSPFTAARPRSTIMYALYLLTVLVVSLVVVIHERTCD